MPTSIAFTADDKFAYVTNQRGGTVSVIETNTGTIIKSISVAGNPIFLIVE